MSGSTFSATTDKNTILPETELHSKGRTIQPLGVQHIFTTMKDVIKNTVTALSKGIGQVMFQGNTLSGLLMLLGLLLASWQTALLALLGNASSTLMAYLCRYNRSDIREGLYGFNGTLVGIAVGVFMPINAAAIAVLVVASALSGVVARLFAMQKFVGGYTAPFILVTWAVLALCRWLCPGMLHPAAGSATAESIDWAAALTMSIGQVMFQGNMLTGILFLVAIAVNSYRNALYAVAATILSVVTAWLLGMDYAALNIGLAGYNGVLCAIALCNDSRLSLLWAMAAAALSVLLQTAGIHLGITTLTAPFVLATWLVQLPDKFQKPKN